MVTKKKVKKPAVVVKKGKKISYEGLTGLALARARRANGEAPKKKKRPARKQVIHKAPEDFKPFFMRLRLAFNKEGILARMQAVSYRGTPGNDNAKAFDLEEFDPTTYKAVLAMFAAGTFVQNLAKRELLANQTFAVMARVGKRAADNKLTVRFTELRVYTAPKKSKVLLRTSAKDKPLVLILNRAKKYLPGAFIKVLPFPTAAEDRATEREAAKAEREAAREEMRAAKIAAREAKKRRGMPAQVDDEEEAPTPKAKRKIKKVAKKVAKKKAVKKTRR